MKYLVIGGTGTMGTPLVDYLLINDDVNVVCRRKKEEKAKANYFYGDANDVEFLKSVLCIRYDAIIDFCWCSSSQFQKKYRLLLDATDQYICLSSAAVVADGETPLDENSPRFLDRTPPANGDEDFYEYHYEKARIEDFLVNSGKNNWTILRPHITYNENHIIWGEFNEEQFLKRCMLNLKVVIPRDILSCRTNMTYGGDVAHMIVRLIGNHNAYGEIFNVLSPYTMTWGEILEVFKRSLRKLGYELSYNYIDDSIPLQKMFPRMASRYTHDRLLHRAFSIDKYLKLIDEHPTFEVFEKQMEMYIERWMIKNKSRRMITDSRSHAYLDRITHEYTSLRYFPTLKEKMRYLICRFEFTDNLLNYRNKKMLSI